MRSFIRAGIVPALFVEAVGDGNSKGCLGLLETPTKSPARLGGRAGLWMLFAWR